MGRGHSHAEQTSASRLDEAVEKYPDALKETLTVDNQYRRLVQPRPSKPDFPPQATLL